jgi:cytidine deaminase
VEKLEKVLHYKVYENINEIDKEAQMLLFKAQESVLTAYAPYSNFKVGSAVLLSNGEVLIGSNQENAAYPSGMCAERVAFFAASANFPNVSVKRVAIVAKRAEESDLIEAFPCGSCRQVMSEYENKQDSAIEVIILGNQGKVIVLSSIEMLLPFKFSARSL